MKRLKNFIHNLMLKFFPAKTQAVAEKAERPVAQVVDPAKKTETVWRFFVEESESYGLKEFVDLASKDEILNKLFPFKSHYTLQFSRCTDFPYDTKDLPNVTLIEHVFYASLKNLPEHLRNSHDFANPDPKVYVVTKNNREYIGEGNANEAL